MSLVEIDRMRAVAEVEFSDVVLDAYAPDMNELRIIPIDGSFLDVWFSLKLPNRYSYHWERQQIDGTIFRYDNAPHKRWETISTFPHHFHNGSEANVTESHLPNDSISALREVLSFVRTRLPPQW